MEKEYPVVLPKHWKENGKTANVYAFIRYLSSRLPENSLTAVSNGACCVVGNQAYVIQKEAGWPIIVLLPVWDMVFQQQLEHV